MTIILSLPEPQAYEWPFPEWSWLLAGLRGTLCSLQLNRKINHSLASSCGTGTPTSALASCADLLKYTCPNIRPPVAFAVSPLVWVGVVISCPEGPSPQGKG